MDIPAGVDDGSTLRLAGHGPAGFRGGPNGALFVHVSVQPDATFERNGVDLHAAVHIPLAMAALGGSVAFDTLDDPATCPSPRNPQRRGHPPEGPGRPQAAGPGPG